MSRAGALLGGLVATGAGLVLAASVLHARETSSPLPISNERILYLQSPRTASRVFLGFRALAADVYWMRAIQHYGREYKSSRKVDRFALLQPLLDLTTSLDPHFNLAYRFGAIFLSSQPPDGPGRPDQAIALLRKGLEANPLRWQYAYDIGFVYYRNALFGDTPAADFGNAATWFARSAAMPKAPEWIQPLAATTRLRGGDRQGARQLLTELLKADLEWMRKPAEHGLHQLQALDAIDTLQALVDAYRTSTGEYPKSWDDLIRTGRLAGRPVEPTTGAPFLYDETSHTVSLSADSELSPLPLAPNRQ